MPSQIRVEDCGRDGEPGDAVIVSAATFDRFSRVMRGGMVVAIDDVSAWESELDNARLIAGSALHEDTDPVDPNGAALPGLSRDQELLWGDWGGVVVIAGILITVVVVLTLTVGALPL